ncbi:HNH endonuclease family protein [Latilactobacillus sakei]|uniref:hypothetical protein n=1 Tax=Latilactobacillus sakei TaxID=1599 RepID=UPI00115ADA6B|nr:hypothetical protein [Latilactobacillus sakei]VTU51880.1 hypothetical protein (plasmid) [Lactobacillus johnsonii] [Latilactobacillus sakei]
MNNSKKSKVIDQNYEDYWATTMALTDFYSNQFIKTLSLIIDHIDNYHLELKEIDELIKNPSSNRKVFRQDVVHAKELEEKIRSVFPNDDASGASTRKQINEFIKLGFIKPYLRGYVDAAKKYVKPRQTEESLRRLFSDTVYNYASFNSSQTHDDTENNQIKFLVRTLINRETKILSGEELIGLMSLVIPKRNYANEKDIHSGVIWVKVNGFIERKYNQISHLKSILNNMQFLSIVKGNTKWEFKFSLKEDAKKYLPASGDTTRDPYRFSIMKKAVYEESQRVYEKKICWLTKVETEGLVVSHIYASADALRNWDVDEAYDPENAILLAPGNPDQYFDKYKITISQSGKMITSDAVSNSFIKEAQENNYKIDNEILTPGRLAYLAIHNQEFRKLHI